jgi:hypothetical protein
MRLGFCKAHLGRHWVSISAPYLPPLLADALAMSYGSFESVASNTAAD